MLSLTVRTGQVVQIGDIGCIKVAEKSGRQVKLIFAMNVKPILILADGLIPARFTLGITGEPRRAPAREVA